MKYNYPDAYHIIYLKITKWSGISSHVKIYLCDRIYLYMLSIGISTYGIIFPLIIKDILTRKSRKDKGSCHEIVKIVR